MINFLMMNLYSRSYPLQAWAFFTWPYNLSYLYLALRTVELRIILFPYLQPCGTIDKEGAAFFSVDYTVEKTSSACPASVIVFLLVFTLHRYTLRLLIINLWKIKKMQRFGIAISLIAFYLLHYRKAIQVLPSFFRPFHTVFAKSNPHFRPNSSKGCHHQPSPLSPNFQRLKSFYHMNVCDWLYTHRHRHSCWYCRWKPWDFLSGYSWVVDRSKDV